MGLSEFLLTIVFTVALGIAVTLTLSDASAWEFWLARGLYIVAALGCLSAYVAWAAMDSQKPLSSRARRWFFGSIAVTVALTSSIGGVSWVNEREHRTVKAQSSPPAPDKIRPDILLPVQPPPNFLLDMFMTDGNRVTGGISSPVYGEINDKGQVIANMFFRVNYHQESRSKYILMYVFNCTDQYATYVGLPRLISGYLDYDINHSPAGKVQMRTQGESNPEPLSSFQFSGRVYLYHVDDLGAELRGQITAAFRALNMAVELRGHDYANGAWQGMRLGAAMVPPEFKIEDRRIVPASPDTHSTLAFPFALSYPLPEKK